MALNYSPNLLSLIPKIQADTKNIKDEEVKSSVTGVQR